MVNSKLRGHLIIFTDDQWVYANNREPTTNKRSCGHCGKETIEDHDGCLGTLPKVMNACCGHGSIDEAYVQFNKNKRISGSEAIAWIEKNK